MPLGARACCPATLWDHHKSRAQTKVEEEAEWERTPCLHFQSSAFLDDVRLRALAAKWEALPGHRTCSPPRRPIQESAMLPVFHSPLEVPTKSPENWGVIEEFVSGAKKPHPGKFCNFTLDKSFLRNWLDHCFQIRHLDKLLQIDIPDNFFENWLFFVIFVKSFQTIFLGQIVVLDTFFFTNRDNRFGN